MADTDPPCHPPLWSSMPRQAARSAPKGVRWLMAVVMAFHMAPLSAQPASGPAQEADGPTHAALSKGVLALYWYSREYPANVAFERGFLRILRADGHVAPEYYSEFLELDRFAGDQESFLRDFLRRKYANQKIDVIVAEAWEPLRFLLENRSLFPGVPIVYPAFSFPTPDEEPLAPGVVGISISGAYLQTVKLALSLHPGARRVFVVTNAANGGGHAREAAVRRELSALDRSIAVTYLADLPTKILIDRLANAHPSSVVLYVGHADEAAGTVLHPLETISLLSAASRAPLYGVESSHFGHGMVGGYLVDFETVGSRAAELALRIADGARPEDLRTSHVPLTPMFDWRQLQRWAVDTAHLPAGALVQFRSRTTLAQYQWYIAGTIAIVFAQSLLIGGLLAQRARRRRAEQVVRTSEMVLRTSYERIRQLAGGLINAQEAVRARIARDLHDDVCQELAWVSMAISDIKRRDGHLRDAHVQEALAALQRRALDLVDGVRRLSHDLHPGTLRQIGLVAALEAHCLEIEQRYDVQVSFRSEGDLRDIGADAALCLFRIAQEALRNATTHADPRRIGVSVGRSGPEIELTVTDDGRGFDQVAVRSRSSGLGLVSMEERAHLLNGHLHVATQPGRGTILCVRVPAGSIADRNTDEAAGDLDAHNAAQRAAALECEQ